jgi:LacI family transcriptional regulator
MRPLRGGGRIEPAVANIVQDVAARKPIGAIVYPPRSPRVLVVLDTFAAWSRGILRGFADVANASGWTIVHYHPGADIPWLLSEFSPAAVVLGPFRGPWPDALRSYPSISVNADRSAEGIASVVPDEKRIGALALRHLVWRGLTNVTTFRFDNFPFAVAREEAFAREAARVRARLVSGWWIEGAAPARSLEEPVAIRDWLKSLPKPCGVFTCSDAWGRVVARYAGSSGLRVPEDLALVGVDNDTIECELIAPPLSSVAVPWRSLGENAAHLVRRALAGRSLARQRVVVPPLDVVTRRSSDVLAVADPTVRLAVTWIRTNTERRVTVASVVAAVNSTRRRLERSFRACLGRTVMHEVRRAHVEAAKRLLTTTAQPLPAIAAQSGFTTAALLSEAFRRETGFTPGEYRRRARALLVEDG